ETATDVDARRVRQPDRRAAVGRNAIDVGVAVHGHRIENLRAVGRPARGEGRVRAFGYQLLRPRRDVVDEDADAVVQIADVDDLLVLEGEAKTIREQLYVFADM